VNTSDGALRFDRRLLHRPGWISQDELARHLGELPDVADKAVSLEMETTGGAGSDGGVSEAR